MILHHLGLGPLRSLKLLASCSTRNFQCAQLCLKRHASKFSAVRTPFLQAIREGFSERTAIVDSNGSYMYEDIIRWSRVLSRHILCNAKRDTKLRRRGSSVILNSERVAFLCPNNVAYTVTQWGVWMSGGMAVPLCKTHPESELEYVIEDSQTSLVISTADLAPKILPIVERHEINYILIDEDAFTHSSNYLSETSPGMETQDDHSSDASNILEDSISIFRFNGSQSQNLISMDALSQKWKETQWKSRGAMLVYTSGTTGRPKGVLTTFSALQAQIQMMVSSWGWAPSDVILHVLPLHHVHGIVNVLACPLWCGATCVMLPSFSAEKVWDMLLRDDPPRVNLFMAVPTVYAKLIEFYQQNYTTPKVQAFIQATLKEKIRLMVSGSAALPQPVMEQWKKISGHTLLERYGMTEIGMALTNPLRGQRVPGAVGNPFPTVEVRIVSPSNEIIVRGDSLHSDIIPGTEGQAGELQVKGPAVFKEYWNKPQATKDTFTEDGWFKTGDTACYENGSYRILGRSSVDIIKSGGYKISALDVERHLLSHPAITEVAVVGLPDITWGQRVAAVVALKPGEGLTLFQLREWGRDRLPSYQIPTEMKVLEEIPRNAMGKVNKKQLLLEVFGIE
ncbi:malonate--CoA ligase ACSF3, mitochondrial-like [Diadema antillarum]|uniref:malonate--CoA ligase ACSF3, mitochondrial-like n=1 Tax=Diadema antillarum TaxID=105358 RepID=UPI003A85A350